MDQNINSIIATMVLGATLLAIFYHIIIWVYNREKLVPYYILFLVFFAVYATYVAGIYKNLLGANFHEYFKSYLAEGSQMMYIFFYNLFVFKAIDLDRTKHPVLFYAWQSIIYIVLVYGIGVTATVVITKTDYHDYIFFPLIRLVIFAIAIVLIGMFLMIKSNLFQKIIFWGSVVFLIIGIISTYVNFLKIEEPISPIEWLTIGSFIDIIFFSAAINYKIRRTIYKLNQNLLNSAHQTIQIQNELINKQIDLENERKRIARDMHDDLGSGLTKINYLVQLSVNKSNNYENLEKIKKTSSELIENMSEIIWAMKQDNDTLEDLISYLKTYTVEYMESNSIVLEITSPMDIQNILVKGRVRRNVFLIVKEILHNIVKHAQAKTCVVHIAVHNNLEIQIADNGIGFNKEGVKQKKGNGLENMKFRIKQLNGILHCETSHSGTKYQIQIPVNNLMVDEPTKDHKSS